MNPRIRQNRSKLLLIIVVSSLSIVCVIFPVILILSASLDPSNALAAQRLIPSQVSLKNFKDLLTDPVNDYPLWLLNSFKISTITAILSVFISSIGAYAFSRFRFRGRHGLISTILIAQIFPNMLTFVAIFLIIKQIGNYIPSMGLNEHGGLILAYLGGAVGGNLWLMKGFFDSIPRDLDEAALIDGASHWQSFLYVTLPLVKPMLVMAGFISYMAAYSDVIIARALLRDPGEYTLSLGMWNFIADRYAERWGLFAAGVLLGAIPILILFYLLQDLVVSGLTRGAVKG